MLVVVAADFGAFAYFGHDSVVEENYFDAVEEGLGSVGPDFVLGLICLAYGI